MREILAAPGATRYILEKYGIRARKKYGQNFLIDANVIRGIIDAAQITEDDCVLEIGPGIGSMTQLLSRAAGKVICVEIDESLQPVLEETLEDCDNVRILWQDILKTDLKALIKAQDFIGKVRVIGNLPYYITTPIIMKLLEEDIDCETITVMMQKEVADRLKAAPGKKECGAISLMVQYFADVKEIAKVPRTVFIPQPKVDSTVLRLDVRKEKPVAVEDEEYFFKVIKAGFAQRRKTVANSLSVLGDVTRAEILEALEKAGIEPVRRGETLSLEEYMKLTEALMHKG